MRNVSQKYLQAALAQETDEVVLICLTISHPDLPAPYYLVNNTEPVVRIGGTFEPMAFKVNLPNEQEDQLPQVSITIDNIENQILVAIRNLSGEKPKMVLEVILASTPDTVEAGPFEFSILSVDYDVQSIQGTLGYEEDYLNTAFPADTYTPVNSPGLFQ